MSTYTCALLPAAGSPSILDSFSGGSMLAAFHARVGFVSSGTPTAVGHIDFERVTKGGTVSTSGTELSNTRMGAGNNAPQTNTTPTEGNVYVILAAGEFQDFYGTWRAPRPDAAYLRFNQEAPAMGIGQVPAMSNQILWQEDMIRPIVRGGGRRGTRRGIWHYNNHNSMLHGVLNQIGRSPFAQNWVGFRPINAEWRQYNNTSIQLGSIPPTQSFPQIVARRFPMPEVYQRLATVSSNFGQVPFPLLGSWQPGTMDPPLVRAQALLQEITPVPLPVGPSPALIPLPQQAATIPPISSAFYQQHPNPVTTAPAVGGIGGMTWYWP